MKTRLQLEADLVDAGKTYSLLVAQTLTIERQSPPQHTDLWRQLRVLEEQRRSALWAYNRIFAQIQTDSFADQPERKEA
jgi:hypothetical protein